MNQNQSFEEFTPPVACTPAKCTEDEDPDRLECRKCKRKVHYECSQLTTTVVPTANICDKL